MSTHYVWDCKTGEIGHYEQDHFRHVVHLEGSGRIEFTDNHFEGSPAVPLWFWLLCFVLVAGLWKAVK